MSNLVWDMQKLVWYMLKVSAFMSKVVYNAENTNPITEY